MPSHSADHHGSCADKMNELTVQLVPDIGSIMLLDPDSCRLCAAFAGARPPGHHTSTALHQFLECICPGGSFADVWLDIAHVTFATLKLPVSKLQMFKNLFSQTAARLPPLSQCWYKIVGLKLHSKPSRREKHFKGDTFYYLDLESHTLEFEEIQGQWLQALRETAVKCNGRCVDERNMQRQHMTIRSFSLKTAAGSVSKVEEAVQKYPATIQCAGIRIQQNIDDAMHPQTGQGIISHAYLHKLQVRYVVPLYSSCVAASYTISCADGQRRLQQQKAKLEDALAQELQNMQLALCSK